MTLSKDEIFEKAQEHLKQNYPAVHSVVMPHCSLFKNTLNSRGIYRVQLDYQRMFDNNTRSAVFEVDPETGDIMMFKENYNWTYWP